MTECLPFIPTWNPLQGHRYGNSPFLSLPTPVHPSSSSFYSNATSSMKFNFVTLAKKQGFSSTQSIHVETIKRLTLHIDADSSTKTP